MEGTPDPWGVLADYQVSDEYYGYPFARVTDPHADFTAANALNGAMLLPDGRRVTARRVDSHVHATLDPALVGELRMDREAFIRARCLARGTVTHDGLPFQLPVETQCLVYALTLTHWELKLDRPGDLSSYTLQTQHAAIGGFNFYQRVDPYYSNFLRLITDLGTDFKVYPLSTHLTHNWLAGNLWISNQASPADLMRTYNLQQLDWLAGIANLWGHPSFRAQPDLEQSLSADGVSWHQMRRMLQFDSYLFDRPTQPPSPWPDLHPGFPELDRTGMTKGLPRI